MKGEALVLFVSVVSLIHGAVVSGPDTSDPQQAAAICARDHTNSVLVAHQHCNKFYKCDHGKPVKYSCSGDLQFDPNAGQCDWPYTVDCGDRIVVGQNPDDCDPEDGNNDDDNEKPVPETPDNTVPPAGNCDPSQAPSICATEGSSGVLVAHENCNMFYKCDQGLPVAFQCPNNLLYNPGTEQCDWPEYVVCGNRVIPDPNCDESEHSNEDTQDNDNTDSGNGSGNCDPSEAPLICATEESDGILVAHENCHKYYICNHGIPIPLKCPRNLLFNPAKNFCDWPENVDCGDRILPTPDTDDNANEEGGNNPEENTPPVGEGGNNGVNDNNGNGPGCGCHNNPAEAPSICLVDGSEGTLVAHENCNQFYVCNGGRPVVMTCPASLFYNPSTEECDWPRNVDCGDRVILAPEDNENEADSNNPGVVETTRAPVTEGNNNQGNDNNGNGPGCGCHDNPAEAPTICATGRSEGTLVAHENCNQFYLCNGGRPVVMTCPASLFYNPSTEECDWPRNVDCGDRVIAAPEDNENGADGNSPGVAETTRAPVTEANNNGGNDNNGNGPGCGCHDNPAKAPAICATSGSEGTLVAHENCNQFYVCNGGRPVVMTCPASLFYNPSTEECDWPRNVDCGDRVIAAPEDNENGADGNSPGEAETTRAPVTEANNNGGNDNNGNGPGCGCHDNPAEAPAICAADGSEGTLVAHENCNLFYVCNGGRPVVMTCPASLFYNPSTEECDWPRNVDCGDRVIAAPEDNKNGADGNSPGEAETTRAPVTEANNNGGNDNNGNGPGCGCHDNPAEALAICATSGSEGTLVAHENCNQFYVCNGGRPVVMTCPASLFYNPSTEECDWPHNVDCGDRITAAPEDNENGGDGSNPGVAETTRAPVTEANNNGGNDNNGNGPGCGCHDNPAEAPAICAGDGSEGTLVAHENCNQFYVCNGGRPVVMTCPASLFYNPSTEECDWPQNVDCGDRITAAPEDNENGGDGSNPGVAETTRAPVTEVNNNGGNDNNGNGPGCGCHDNPAEAPAICAADGSEGTLVAHENCNQFYVCNGGRPVVMTCPASLFYNPSTEECDWPRNVDCGDRVIAAPEDNENGADGNSPGEAETTRAPVTEANNNGGNDNNGNGPGCGCHDNPAEALAICATSGSEGTLVAHENCNQFYVCNGGRPVVMTCPASLFYNPSTEECDWPHNVDCGDRITAAPEDNENGGDGSNPGVAETTRAPVTEANNNGGNDNNGNGPGCGCHDNPAEAPAICAADGSEGTLVAHENCNQFYVCNGGRPVVMTCPASLFYNPSTEECDWPQNVDCGDRITAAPEDNENGGDGSNPGVAETTRAPVTEVNNNGSNDNNGNGPGCGCHDNPAEAPAICATSGSEGTLVAHENCNQFYVCNGGRPVVMTCPASLFYNPSTEECDWPHNVDCGDRVTAAPEDNENGGDGSNPGVAETTRAPVTEGNNNGGNDNSGNGTGCGCHNNPAEAPAICAADGSEGTLIAHENCNQFYVCNGGRPLVMTCPASLLYNPSTEQCDWAYNVDCGNRNIPDPNCDDSNDIPSQENDEQGNGVDGSCYDNPAEAPAICAADNSEGVLVAHECCNQFYICDGGRPVALSCPAGLFYNPVTEKCDWPKNVNCGYRTIPGNSNEDGSEEVSSNENHASDENDKVIEEDDPLAQDAQKICASPGSEGTYLPHKNCHQFHVCIGGVANVLTCPATLYYDEISHSCLWPQNVNCGNRIM